MADFMYFNALQFFMFFVWMWRRLERAKVTSVGVLRKVNEDRQTQGLVWGSKYGAHGEREPITSAWSRGRATGHGGEAQWKRQKLPHWLCLANWVWCL